MSETKTQVQSSLRERQTELTRKLIIDNAVALLVEDQATELSVRAVANRASMSERTIFRYFENRDALLDATVEEINARQKMPPLPASIDDLETYVAALFQSFDADQALITAALRSEIYERIRTSDRARRGRHIQMLVDDFAPHVDPARRRLIASNIHYHVIASTWNYYRFRFGFSLDDTIAAAQIAIGQAVAALKLA